MDAVVRFEGKEFKHLAFNTRPWSSIAEFKQVRSLVDDYIKETSRRCLKTKRDYEVLADFFDTRRSLPVSEQKYLKKTGEADLKRLRRDLCCAFKQGMAGLDEYADMTANEFAAVLLSSGLAKYGVPCSRADVQNGKKSAFKPHATPRMDRVIEVIKSVREKLPKLDIDEILSDFSNEQPLREAIDGTCQFTSRLTTA